jgi:hypothetical protein
LMQRKQNSRACYLCKHNTTILPFSLFFNQYILFFQSKNRRGDKHTPQKFLTLLDD